MSVRLIVGDDDLTERASDLEWSNVDPGGHETCSFALPNDCSCPQPGNPVAVWEGLQRVWMGRVEEPGDNYDERRAPGQVGAVGAGAALKDNDVSMVFSDRALSRWTGPSVQRQLDFIGVFPLRTTFEVTPDTTTGNPALVTWLSAPWGINTLTEVAYDAGHGNLIASLKGNAINAQGVNFADANWAFVTFLAATDTATSVEGGVDVRATGSGVDFSSNSATGRRFAFIQQQHAVAFAGTNDDYRLAWRNLRVIGNHGLTIRGATPAEEGFYPEDIAGWAVDQVDGIDRGQFDASGVILPHSVYHTPVPHEQIIADMAVWLGWHYGVWAPESLLSDTPLAHFRAPATDATASVSRGDCRQLRLAQQLSAFHNQARVSYTDAAGTAASVLVTRPNPRLPAGLTRTLSLDIGQADANVAQAVGEDALALEEQQTRAAGQTELPPEVTAPTGRKPAHLLRAGIDRLKISGLPRSGPWTEADTRRFDVFRLKRTNSRLMPGGAVVTAAELDSGANLQETINARLALAAELAG